MASSCFLCDPKPPLLIGTTPRLQVVAGLGPISDTYLVIGALRHLRCMGDVVTDDPAVEGELLAVFEWMKRERSSFLVTEHGRMALCALEEDEEAGSAAPDHDDHCYHAHMLAFETPKSIDEQLKTYFLTSKTFDELGEALRYAATVESYILSWRADGGISIYSDPLQLPRQLTRVLAAHQLGTPELGDWRLYPNEELARRTSELLRPSFMAEFIETGVS